MSDDSPTVVTPGDGPIDLPATPRASVEVIACGDCAKLDRIGPLTLLASAIEPCPCACRWDQFVCQICGKPVGIRAPGGTIDLGDVDVDVDVRAGWLDRYRDIFREELPSHLDLTNPGLAECNRCHRRTWYAPAVGSEDRMTQPDGGPCGGRFEPLT